MSEVAQCSPGGHVVPPLHTLLTSPSPPIQSLALAHCDIDESGTVLLSPWTETDFR